ncbi:dnaJ homolog subfamily C member 2-like [Leptinotarsa decemlineata]|uniref:dnaJ homolog subfamily C member 2-like n=1 Tax=Leptinotarsa decemlineata TaxID=7539 RepID=UPI003D30905A
MGKAKGKKINSSKTVAIRYRFVFDNAGGGEPLVKFLPHPVIVLKVDPPKEKNTDVLTPENVEFEDDIKYLRSLDPKEWKSQDHYKVLGIPRLRYRATDEIIKVAYRKKVLKHHPDKRKALGEEIKKDDDYFTCITMAYETLGNISKRRAYDSVDPQFDNTIPSVSDIKKDFYSTFNYYFGLNSRWSEKPRIPQLGDADSTREEVDEFYSFWYDFKSWRDYSYDYEEDKDKCQDREERRYISKLNKAERLRKKKEEMARIRQLVDMAYYNDPRIAKFKQDEIDKKLAGKRAKQAAAQAKKEEDERVLREAMLAKEQAEAAERAKLKAIKQEREAQKKAIKKERKTLRTICKENDYFAENSEQNLAHLTGVESLCETLSLNELEKLNAYLKTNGKPAFLEVLKGDKAYLEKEHVPVLDSAKQATTVVNESKTVMVAPERTEDNVELLVKAVNIFPAGTNQEFVFDSMENCGAFPKKSNKFNIKMVLTKAEDSQATDFSNNNLKGVAKKQGLNKNKKNVLHNDANGISKSMENLTLNGDDPKPTASVKKSSSKRKTELSLTTSKQQLLLAKAKDSQDTDFSKNNLKEVVNKQPFDNFKNNKKKVLRTDGNEVSKNMDNLNGADRKPTTSVKKSSSKTDIETKTAIPWTATEQQLLEQALKKYPASTAERWNRIAECIPFRTKKECMIRCKKLVKATKAQVEVTK